MNGMLLSVVDFLSSWIQRLCDAKTCKGHIFGGIFFYITVLDSKSYFYIISLYDITYYTIQQYSSARVYQSGRAMWHNPTALKLR